MKDYSREIALLCPLCGNDQFSAIDQEYDNLDDAPDTAKVQCSDCKSVYTKDELIEENAEKIDIAIKEITDSFLDDIEKDFIKLFN